MSFQRKKDSFRHLHLKTSRINTCLIEPVTIIRRTVQFGLSHYPGLDKEGHWQRTLAHLHEKYAEGGYLHLLIPGSPNEAPLAELRGIIRDTHRLRTIFEDIYTESL